MFKLKKDLRGNAAMHSTLHSLYLHFVFAVFVSIFKLLGYLRFLHLNLAHKLRLYIFLAVYISRYKKKKKIKVSSEAESKSQT